MADDDQALQKQIEDAKKLPIDERVKHSNWKVRSDAFEHIKDACGKAFDEGDPVLDDFTGLFPKAMLDSNAPALDKALEALSSFLSKCSEAQAHRIADKTCHNIVLKCLSGRPGTVMKATDVFMLFIELEQADKVLAALVDGFGHKVPKAVVACLEVLHQAISLFGAKVVPWQPVLKAAPPLFESKDNKARSKMKEIVLEIARWTGTDIIKATLLDKVRDFVKAELEAAMSQAPAERPQPERLTRTAQQQAQVAAAAGGEEADDDGTAGPAQADAEEEDDPMDMDCYEDLPPKDILPELKKDFWEGVESKKWLERKGALSTLRELATYPKLQPGDFGDVNRVLKKIISKDSNVQVVAEAILCCGTLGKGLRAAYGSTARSLCSVLLEKFKEKNAAVQKAVSEALAHMHKYCFTLQDVIEDITASLGHTNPKVREETIKWLTETMGSESKQSLAALPRDKSGPLLAAIGKCAEDASPSLREAGMALLVTYAVKVGSASVLDKVTAKMDDTRKKKLDELIDEALRARKGGKPAAASASRPAPGAGMASAPRAAPAARPAPERSAAAKPAAASRTGGSKSAASSSAGGSAAAPKAAKAAGHDAEDEGSLNAGALSKEDALDRFTEHFGESIVKDLQDPLWKARLEAMDSIAAQAGGMTDHCSMLVQGLTHLPGWNEKNFQVMAKVFEVVGTLAHDAEGFSKKDAFCIISGLVDKVADVKLQGPACDALSNMCEAVGPQFVFSQMHKKAAAHKNPKVLTVTLTWMARTIEEFGPQPLNMKALLDWMKEDLGSANAAVRTAATGLLGVLHRFMGPALADMLRADVKPALMTAIEAEFAKNPQVGGISPVRFSRAEPRKAAAAAAGGAAAGGRAGKGGKGAAAAAAAAPAMDAFDPDELLPRTDISDEVSGAFISKLNSANWKERKEAMEQLEAVLQGAGYRIQPQVGELMSALKQRMVDTNRNLTVVALQLVGKLARAMGRAIDRVGRPVLAPAIKNVSDPKILVRAAVVEMLDAWVAAAGPETLVAELAEAVAAPKCSAEGRKMTLEWVTGLAASGKVGDALADAVRCAALGSGDKAVEVREAASKLLVTLIESVGTADVGTAMHSLGTVQKKAVLELYAKVTGGAAAPTAGPTPSAAPSRPSSTAAATRTSAANLRSSVPAATRAPASRQSSARPTSTARASAASISVGAAAPSDDGPLFHLDDRKDERAKKAKFKPARLEIKPDEVVSLEESLREVAAPGLAALMCAKDFKKHCEAAELIKATAASMYDNVVSCLDLIFRWATLRLVDANTQSLVKVLDMLKVVLELLVEQEYRLTDHEAKALLPGLVEKAGHNADRIRADHRELLRKAALLYPSLKVMAFVKDGLESKNNRTRVECAEEVGSIIDRGAGVTPKQVDAVQAVARLVAERDTALRKAVLSTMEVVYSFEGDGIWRLLGKLTDQQKSLIEERLKYVDRELAKKGLRAGHRRGEAAEADDLADGPTPAASAIPARGAYAASTSALPSAFGAPTAQTTSAGSSANNSRNNSPTKHGYPQVRASAPLIGSAPSLPLHAPAPSRQVSMHQPPAAQTPTGQDSAPMQPSPFSGTPYGRKTDAEMEEEFMRCLSVLRLDNLEEAVEAMKSLCYQFMELPRMSAATVNLCCAYTDELVRLLAAKTDAIFVQATSCPPGVKDIPNSRACKYSLNTLMNTFQTKGLAAAISEDGLQDLIGVLLMRLLDKRLPDMTDGNALLKAINVLMIRVLDHSNRTNTFCALIRLLLHPHPGILTAPAADNTEFRWAELVVKCLIKITKGLPLTIDQINLRQLLLACHNFFTELGEGEVKARGHRDDKPVRMVKTLLNELCRHKGQDIYRYTDIIPSTPTQPPLIFSYIELHLSNARAMAAPAPAPAPVAHYGLHPAAAPAANGAPLTAAPAAGIGAYRADTGTAASTNAALQTGGSSRPAFSHGASGAASSSSGGMSEQQAARNMLAAIFKRIGDRREPEKALRELHYFMEEHPSIEVNQFLGNASEQFRTFINKGLARVRANIAQEAADAAGAHEPLDHDPAMAGLAANGATGPSGGAGLDQEAAPAAGNHLAELKERMTRIQGETNSSQAAGSSLHDLRERLRHMGQLQPQPH